MKFLGVLVATIVGAFAAYTVGYKDGHTDGYSEGSFDGSLRAIVVYRRALARKQAAETARNSEGAAYN